MPTDPATLHRLRQRIAQLERAESPHGGGARDSTLLTFGLPAVDDHLPWGGLAAGCVHEIVDGDPQAAGLHRPQPGAAATAFAAALAGRRQDSRSGTAIRPVLWIAPRSGQHESLYRHGLAAFGLDPDSLLLVRIPANGRTGATQTLWALEEALRERAVGLVCAEIDTLDLAASRRLQLAAAAGGTTGLLLRSGTGAAVALPPTASVTRWRIASAPSADLGIPRWRVELLRARNGRPRRWLLEWRHDPDTSLPATAGFALAAALRDRPDLPPQQHLADADASRQAA